MRQVRRGFGENRVILPFGMLALESRQAALDDAAEFDARFIGAAEAIQHVGVAEPGAQVGRIEVKRSSGPGVGWATKPRSRSAAATRWYTVLEKSCSTET